MPSTYVQAKFDPLPPDLDLNALVEKTPNFDYVIRISTEQIEELGLAEFEKLILLHVIIGGRPLVVEGWQADLTPWLFSSNWLQDNIGKKEERVRDIGNSTDMPMTVGHYLSVMEKLTRQWTPTNFREPRRQRLYLKDIDCPDTWHKHLEKLIPQQLFYLNESSGDLGGPGSQTERNEYSQMKQGKGIAPSGDLMSSLPPEMRAQNMMCYIGHEGTYTPAHREMCASLGQNIMVETSEVVKGEKPGTSVWFMTESKDREVVSEYFLSMLGHDIEVENHFAQVNAWKKAPFPVYIVEQKVGDFILIPPLAPHQVWNRGTRTMKVAWNRTTVETLELALHEALPRARMVCRDEQYKNKAIVFYTLIQYADRIKRIDVVEDMASYGSVRDAPRVRQLKKDFKRLFMLFQEILLSEMFSPDLPKEKKVEYEPFDSNITCSYCRCNIFNRFLTCKTCVGDIDGTDDKDTYDICMECYAMGRSCGCLSNLTWVEQWQWPVLLERYSECTTMIITNIDGNIDDGTPLPLEIVRKNSGKKSIAQVCQEQLKLRPWRDINKPFEAEPPADDSDADIEVDDEGRLKKPKMTKRKSAQLDKDTQSCHICQKREWKWKLGFCSTCKSAYCYGTLWRAFDLKPQTVMENPDWSCPKCLGICSCGKCRRNAKQTPYRPKGTLLGHDTKKVADVRSVESLVDFSKTNLGWLRGEGDEDPQSSLRMQRLMEKADAEQARINMLAGQQAVDPSILNTTDDQITMEDMSHDTTIDPSLRHDGHLASKGTPNNNEIRRDQSHFGLSTSFDTSSSLPDSSMYNGDTVAPMATMIPPPPEYSYPDPLTGGAVLTASRTDHQTEDLDRILFDDPSGITVDESHSNSSYPRLPALSNDTPLSVKRQKLDNGQSADVRPDTVHMQYITAQKKQKLLDAKKAGTFYITQNQLEGGGPLVVRLRFKRSKMFLLKLRDLEQGSQSARHNTRPRRSTVQAIGGMAASSDGTVDVQQRLPEPGTSIYKEDDLEEDIAIVAERMAVEQARRFPTATPVNKGTSAVAKRIVESDHTPPMTTKQNGTTQLERQPQVLSTRDRRSLDSSNMPSRTSALSKNMRSKSQSTGKSQRRVTFSGAVSEHEDTSDSDRSIVQEDDNDYTPIRKTPGAKSTLKQHRPAEAKDTIQDAKWQAFEEVEAELKTDNAKFNKSAPSAPPARLLSMAERRAMQGKTFKIAARTSTSSPAQAPSKPPSTSTPSSKPAPGAVASKSPALRPTTGAISFPKLPSTFATAAAESSDQSDSESSDGDSDGDSDASIPATRPETMVMTKSVAGKT